MNQMPLLPRSCEVLAGVLGEANSRWSWTSPKLCLLTSAFSPLPSARGTEVAAPSLTVHGVVCFCHASSDVPSNRTIASEGGAPGTVPGVTTVGYGRSESCTCHLP